MRIEIRRVDVEKEPEREGAAGGAFCEVWVIPVTGSGFFVRSYTWLEWYDQQIELGFFNRVNYISSAVPLMSMGNGFSLIAGTAVGITPILDNEGKPIAAWGKSQPTPDPNEGYRG